MRLKGTEGVEFFEKHGERVEEFSKSKLRRKRKGKFVFLRMPSKTKVPSLN